MNESLLSRALLEAITRHGDQPALQDARTKLSYRQLRRLIIDFSLHLRDAGVTRDSVIIVHLHNPLLVMLAAIATSLLGARWMQGLRVDWAHFGLPATHILVPSDSELGEHRSPQARVLVVDRRWLQRPPAYREQGRHEFQGAADSDRAWNIVASSGTTGRRKLMAMSERDTLVNAQRMGEPLAGREGMPLRACVLFPPGGLGWTLMTFHLLLSGGTLVVGADYDFWLRAQVDLVLGSPHQLRGCVAQLPRPPSAPAITVRCAGGAIPAILFEELQPYFANVVTSYGSTETGRLSAHRMRAGGDSRCVGRPLGDCTIEIVDDEHDQPVAMGVEGRVRARSPCMVSGYLGDAKETDSRFRGGWFYTGDLGFLSPSGELFITGRSNDVLNLGGLKINAAMLDEALRKVQGIHDALCFAEPGKGGVDGLSVLIVPAATTQSSELLADLVQRTASRAHGVGYQIVKHVYRVSELPRNDNGKLLRRQAAAIAESLTPLA